MRESALYLGINKLYRHYEDPLKAPPAYSYLAPRAAFTFGVSRHLAQSPFLINFFLNMGSPGGLPLF